MSTSEQVSCELEHVPGDLPRLSEAESRVVDIAYLLTLKPTYDVLPPFDHDYEITAPYPCLQCRKRCDTLPELELHRIWHRRENQCSLCLKTFTTPDIFKSHIRKHYVDVTKDYSVNNKILERPVTCSFCPEEFPTLRDLHLHTQLYSDTYRECGECGVYLPACHKHDQFNTDLSDKYRLNSLRSSVLSEAGIGEVKPARIHSSVSTYRYHLKTDHVKPYTCDVCCTRFADSRSLREHLNDHFTEHKLLYNGNTTTSGFSTSGLTTFPHNPAKLTLKEQNAGSMTSR